MQSGYYLEYMLIGIIVLILRFYRRKSVRQRSALMLVLTIDQIKIKGVIKMTQLKTTQFVSGELQPVDRLGNAAKVEAGTAKFTSSNEEVFVVERDPNLELVFKIVPKGPGVAQLDYSADADLGEGVKLISGFTGIEVIPAEATGFGIKFGEPEEIPIPETTEG